MSVSVHNVLKAHTQNVFEVVEELHTLLSPVRDRYMAKQVMEYAIEILDTELYHQYIQSDTMLIHAAQQLWVERQKSMQQRSVQSDPLQCVVTFYQTTDQQIFLKVNVTSDGAAYLEALRESSLFEFYETGVQKYSEDKAVQQYYDTWRQAVENTVTVQDTSLLNYAVPFTDEPFMCSGLNRTFFYDEAVRLQPEPEERLFAMVQGMVQRETVIRAFYLGSHRLPPSHRQHISRVVKNVMKPFRESITEYGALPARLTVQNITQCISSFHQVDFQVQDAFVQSRVEECIYQLRQQYKF